MTTRPMRTPLAAAVFLLAALPAAAATCTGISAVGLGFGSYDVFSALPDDTAGSLTYSCTAAPAVSFSASLDGALGPREMLHVFGPDVLRYDVYSDAARTVAWTTDPVLLKPGNRTIPFYGRIFAGQDVATGFYADAVTITLNF
ncbi:MAG TPA: spore coat U domain-containing protein [Myxococcales bacterium]